jgi:hypothetical protein
MASGLPIRERLEALDAFVRDHPGTIAAAKALYHKGFQLGGAAIRTSRGPLAILDYVFVEFVDCASWRRACRINLASVAPEPRRPLSPPPRSRDSRNSV